MGLPWHQLHFVKNVSCAEPVSLGQQAAAVPSSAGLLPVCTCSHPGWQRQLSHTLDSHMRCQAQHKPCAPSPASSQQLRHPRSLHPQRGFDRGVLMCNSQCRLQLASSIALKAAQHSRPAQSVNSLELWAQRLTRMTKGSACFFRSESISSNLSIAKYGHLRVA